MATPIAQFSKKVSTIAEAKKVVKGVFAIGGKAVPYANGTWIDDRGDIAFCDGTQVIASMASKKCSINVDGVFIWAKPMNPNSLPFRIDADIY